MLSYRSGSSWVGSRFRWQHVLLLSCMLLGLAGCDFTFSTPATPTPTTLAQVKPPRINSLMAYDTARHLMVLFGGAISSTLAAQPTNQTWTWDGKGWKRVHPDTAPPALDGVMAYDAASQQIILLLYQIKSGPRVDNQMWAWDGTTWSQLHPTTIPAVIGASMAYDAVRHQIILFGGGVPNEHDTTFLNTTWTWDGTTWTQRAPPSSPEPRTNAAMAYNSAAQEIILYGGSGQAATFNDLWTWDGITWTQQYSAQIPPARQQGYLVYDDARHQALVFGGIDAIHLQPLDDTWAWDGTDWTEVVSQGGPANLYQSAAYDPDHQQVVVYAGQGNPNASPPTAPVSQTWIWNGSTWKRLG